MKKVFSSNLRAVRRQLGWKTSMIAANRLGINRPAYQSYEEGRVFPGVQVLINMANIMGIKDLLGFISNPQFDYRNQDLTHRSKDEPFIVNYRTASERDRKIIDQLLGMPTE